VRYWPLAARRALAENDFDAGLLKAIGRSLDECSDRELFNLSIDTVIRLRRELVTAIDTRLDRRSARRLAEAIEAERVESLGVAEFHMRHPDLGSPCVMVPVTGHYSWEKALKLLGMGSANVVRVRVDERMRMDPADLDRAIAEATEAGRPVLAVIGVLGTTEFGSIDPIDEIVALRQRWRKRGVEYAIHIDAAWGGYLASIFRQADGTLVDRQTLQAEYRYFPSSEVHGAFAALRHADSITVDPHKLGFVPFGCGAYVARNRGMTDFISQRAAYVFDDAENVSDSEYERRFRNLGQYILEGSKPGAAAAGVWVTHRVLPLDHDHFGRLCGETIVNSEYFFDHIEALRAELEGIARVILPFEPDTNLVCLAINPEGNRDLGEMNRFGRRLYAHLSVGEDMAIHTRQFFGSRTLVQRNALSDEVARRMIDELGLDPDTFVEDPDDSGCQADSIFLLRHTLMNPWLSGRDHGLNYLDRYCRYLASLVRLEIDRSPKEL